MAWKKQACQHRHKKNKKDSPNATLSVLFVHFVLFVFVFVRLLICLPVCLYARQVSPGNRRCTEGCPFLLLPFLRRMPLYFTSLSVRAENVSHWCHMVALSGWCHLHGLELWNSSGVHLERDSYGVRGKEREKQTNKKKRCALEATRSFLIVGGFLGVSVSTAHAGGIYSNSMGQERTATFLWVVHTMTTDGLMG